MAILNNIIAENSQFGIAFNDAYYRIVSAVIIQQPSIIDAKFMVMIDLCAYATNSPNDETRDVDSKRFNANLTDVEAKTGDTFLAKCYAWVMDQDDMAGSTAA